MFTFINLSNMLFIMINMITSLYMISTNCWINCFLAMEINLFFFIPMIFSPNLFNMEIILKYFIIQVISSSLMMMSILNYKTLIFNTNMLTLLLMNFSLLMKLGSVPFHYWYIEISHLISWNMFFMLSTWQKIGPMILLFYNLNFMLINLTVIMNSIISFLGGMNQISIKKMMGFSSINHLSWMIATFIISETMMLIYLMTYMIMMFFNIMLFNQINFKNIYQMFFKHYNINMSIIMIVSFISLAGLPPFLGFIPKWMTINKLINYKMVMISIILIMCSLMNLFYYFKISYYLMMNKNFKMNYLINFNYKLMFYILNYMILMNSNYLMIFFLMI